MLIGALVEEVAYEDHLVHFGGSTATDGTLQRTELDFWYDFLHSYFRQKHRKTSRLNSRTAGDT